MSRNVKELEEKIGYNFKDSHLLRHAVTHTSDSRPDPQFLCQ